MDKEKKILETVQKFYNIAKEEYDISRVVLFGSYVNNTEKPESDIDIAIILNTNDSDNRMAISSKLFRIAAKIDSRIEPKCFFANEIAQADPASIYSMIIKTGIELKIN